MNVFPHILQFRSISNLAAGIYSYILKLELLYSCVTLSTFKCWYKYDAKISQIYQNNKRNTKFNKKKNPHNLLCYTDFIVISYRYLSQIISLLRSLHPECLPCRI